MHVWRLRGLLQGGLLLGGLIIAAPLVSACGQDAPPPPVPVATTPGVVPNTATAPPGVPGTTPGATAPPGMTLITVVANSTPAGATVVGGGSELGTTPLTTQVPIPTPAPGQQPPAFDFEFRFPGFRSTTVQATPLNDMITVQATLLSEKAAEQAAATVEPEEPDEQEDEPSGGRALNVRGSGGGAIRDHQTVTARANVTEDCTLSRATVVLQGNHSYHQDLVVTLRGPNGISATLQRSASRNPFRSHRIRRVAGKNARGAWTVSVEDRVAQDSGRLRGFRLRLRCR